MKKFILLLALALFFVDCSNDSNSSNSNNSSGNVDYEFTITLNGTTHKIAGNTSNGFPYGSTVPQYNYINNKCYIGNSGTIFTVDLTLNDPATSNFVSGTNISALIIFNNGLTTGINQASVMLTGGAWTNFCNSLGVSPYGIYPGQSLSQGGKLNFNITDLGTPSNTITLPFTYGNTVKGNYSGTIYLLGSGNSFIPAQLSIDFKAVRYNY